MDITVLNSALPANVYAGLSGVMAKYTIDDVLKLAHFLGQCDYESEHFTAVRENLNYSANALLATFPTHFDSTSAAAYARQPEKIANHVYANRMGNGNEASGDGWNFRGRGYIQLTGKVNYKAFSNFMGVDTVSSPELVATDYPMASAAFFFHANNLFAVCDRGATNDVVTAVTKIINGGTNGLQDRIKTVNKYYNLLQTSPQL